MQIAKGDLLGVQNPAVTFPGGTSLDYSWDDNSGQGTAKPTDHLVVVVYAPVDNLYYTTLDAGVRNAGSSTVSLPGYFAGLEVQSWITFAAADGKSYATSVYMGAVTIAP